MAFVHPDGCRDLIVLSCSGEPDKVFLTDWDLSARRVALQSGTDMIGFRLRPGTTFDPRCMSGGPCDLVALADMLESEAKCDQDVTDTIHALTQPHATIKSAARKQGVTARTLQRLFKNLSLPSPEYWRLLGRARRAANGLQYDVLIAQTAYAYGYSDQAHMTREFARWFGLTPNQLRRNELRTTEIRQRGLGNWTACEALELNGLI